MNKHARMTALLKISICALCFVCSLADVLRYGFPPEIVENEEGSHWAVIVAGSSGWMNYRHQVNNENIFILEPVYR